MRRSPSIWTDTPPLFGLVRAESVFSLGTRAIAIVTQHLEARRKVVLLSPRVDGTTIAKSFSLFASVIADVVKRQERQVGLIAARAFTAVRNQHLGAKFGALFWCRANRLSDNALSVSRVIALPSSLFAGRVFSAPLRPIFGKTGFAPIPALGKIVSHFNSIALWARLCHSV